MKKYSRPITALLMAVAFMVLYLCVYRHTLIYHEQHHLFVFTADYIRATAHEKGLLRPIMEFVVQFGYWPWLGATVWTAILVATYLMTSSVIRRLSGWRDSLGLSAILPAWMFFRTVNIDVKPTGAVAAFLIVLGLWILALIAGAFRRPRKRPENTGKWWWILVAPAMFAASMSWFHRSIDAPRTLRLNNGVERTFSREEVKAQRVIEAKMIKADQAIRRGDWPEVQRITEDVLSNGQKNLLMSYYRAIALYRQGQLANQLFNVPQKLGLRSLFFPWKPDKNQAEYGGYIYEQLGALNTAIHWEFEALVGWGETAQHLTKLSKYYIATGKPEQARKFIYPLKHTLFYRSTAAELEADMARGEVPGLRDAFAGTKAPELRWDAVQDLNSDLAFLLNFDRSNTMASDYLLMGLLLKNNVGAFYTNLHILYPDGSADLPEVYQQALCLACMGFGAEKLREDGFVISPKVEAEFQAYVQEHSKGKTAFYTPAMKRTYWYYIHHISPEGQNVNI